MADCCAAADVEKNIVVPITTDKGLCGGINSTVCKYVRASLNVTGHDGAQCGSRLTVKVQHVLFAWDVMCLAHAASMPSAEGRESSIVVLGEKGKAQLQRDQRSHIRTTITELGKFKMTFAQVGTVLVCICCDNIAAAFGALLTADSPCRHRVCPRS